ncbi:MAG: hypothetical protein ACLTE2_01190 [Eubacteriales bacterium]
MEILQKRKSCEHPGGVTIAALTRMTMNFAVLLRQFQGILMKLFYWNYHAGKLRSLAKTSPWRLPRENLREETGAVGKDCLISLEHSIQSLQDFCDEVLPCLCFCRSPLLEQAIPDEDENFL